MGNKIEDLDSETIKNIKDAKKLGVKNKIIASLWGLSMSDVSDILNNKI